MRPYSEFVTTADVVDKSAVVYQQNGRRLITDTGDNCLRQGAGWSEQIWLRGNDAVGVGRLWKRGSEPLLPVRVEFLNLTSPSNCLGGPRNAETEARIEAQRCRDRFVLTARSRLW
jgi:hypothetical protein